MKKFLAALLALPALAFSTPSSVQKDTVTNQLLYGGFKVPSSYVIEIMSGGSLVVDSGATFTFPSGSIAWSAISSTPTTLSGYGITDAQAENANLTALSGLVSATDTLGYFTGSGTASLATFTSFGRSLVASANAAGAQSVLALVPGTNVQAHSSVLDAVAGGTYPGATSITTLGTIGAGTWNATPISLTANVSGILPTANGGTNNAFFTVVGPATSPKNYTFPNASANVLTDNALVTAAQGGDGVNNGSAIETRGGNITFAGAFTQSFTATANTAVTLPIAGTLSTLAGTENLTNKTINGLTPTSQSVGFTLAGGTTSKGLTVTSSLTLTAGSDGLTLNIGAGGTLGSAAFTNTGAYEVPLTFSTGLTRTTNTITVNTSQNIATLSNLTGNGIVQTSGGAGTLSVNTPTGSGAVVEATGPAISGGSVVALTSLGIRDLSAAFDVTLAANSSTPLTAGRTLTIDMGNNPRTLQFTGNAVLNQDVSSAGSPTFANPIVTTLSLGATTPGIISGASGALTLTGAGTNQNIRLNPSGTGSVVINAGTATNPAIVTTGDTGTGFYHPSSGQIGFSIAGTSVGFVSSTGLNGINLGATTKGSVAATTLSSNSTTSLATTTITGTANVVSTLSGGGAATLIDGTLTPSGNTQSSQWLAIGSTGTYATGTFTGLAYYGIEIYTPTMTGSGLGTAYQIYIPQAPAMTTHYGIYQAGTDPNVLSGNLTVTGTTALLNTTMTGSSGTFPLEITGNSVAGASNGLFINAGTNGSDNGVEILNFAQNLNLLTITGAGTATMGGTLTVAGGITSTSTLTATANFSGQNVIMPASPDTFTVYNNANSALTVWNGPTGKLTQNFDFAVAGAAQVGTNTAATSTLTVGLGGSSAVDAQIILNSGTGAASGPVVGFDTGGSSFGYLGSQNAILGGATNALLLLAEQGNLSLGTGSGGIAETIDVGNNATFAAKIVTTGQGGMGYATGAGGAVTQATSKATGVTLNKINGDVTMNNASLANATAVIFTLTDSQIGADDHIGWSIIGGTSSAYSVQTVGVTAGGCNVAVVNNSGGSLGEALVLHFNVFKGSNS